jgi:hypothetical protein
MVVDVELVIPHRTPEYTKSALRYAEALGVEDIQVLLIDIHVVPYGVSLGRPTIQRKHLERRLRRLARETNLRASAEVVYARNWEQGLRRVLSSVSTDIIADPQIFLAHQREEIGCQVKENRPHRHLDRPVTTKTSAKARLSVFRSADFHPSCSCPTKIRVAHCGC